MVVIAGPPGSGKSTVFRPNQERLDYFNADERARDLNGGSGRRIPLEIRAQVNKELEQFITLCIQQLRSFAFETTLRTKITYEQARLAKANGFEISMIYAALNSAEESIRVLNLKLTIPCVLGRKIRHHLGNAKPLPARAGSSRRCGLPLVCCRSDRSSVFQG